MPAITPPHPHFIFIWSPSRFKLDSSKSISIYVNSVYLLELEDMIDLIYRFLFVCVRIPPKSIHNKYNRTIAVNFYAWIVQLYTQIGSKIETWSVENRHEIWQSSNWWGFSHYGFEGVAPGVSSGSWLTHSSRHRAAADHLPELDSYLINDNSCQFPTMSCRPPAQHAREKHREGGCRTTYAPWPWCSWPLGALPSNAASSWRSSMRAWSL